MAPPCVPHLDSVELIQQYLVASRWHFDIDHAYALILRGAWPKIGVLRARILAASETFAAIRATSDLPVSY